MYNITSFYLRANRYFEPAEKLVSVVFISSIVIIVFAGTVARYFLDEPIFGADRLATYLMVWLGFLGFQIAVSKMRHIEIEVIKTKVKARTRHLLNIISSLAGAFFMLVFSVLAWEYMNESRLLDDRDVVLDIPLWWVILIIPISFSISSVRSLFNAMLWYDIFSGKRKEEDIFRKQLL